MTGSGGPPKPAAQPGKKGRQVLSPLITDKKEVVAVPPGSFMPAAHFYPRVLNAVSHASNVEEQKLSGFLEEGLTRAVWGWSPAYSSSGENFSFLGKRPHC